MLERYPDKVKLVIKHFPLRSHKYAQKAAKAALAAGMQGKFWGFHHKLFENYKSLDDSKIEQIAAELSLEMEKFGKDRNDPKVQALINKDIRDGVRAGVRGTPTAFVNGKNLKKRNLQGFYRMIEAELSKISERMEGKNR